MKKYKAQEFYNQTNFTCHQSPELQRQPVKYFPTDSDFQQHSMKLNNYKIKSLQTAFNTILHTEDVEVLRINKHKIYKNLYLIEEYIKSVCNIEDSLVTFEWSIESDIRTVKTICIKSINNHFNVIADWYSAKECKFVNSPLEFKPLSVAEINHVLFNLSKILKVPFSLKFYNVSPTHDFTKLNETMEQIKQTNKSDYYQLSILQNKMLSFTGLFEKYINEYCKIVDSNLFTWAFLYKPELEEFTLSLESINDYYAMNKEWFSASKQQIESSKVTVLDIIAALHHLSKMIGIPVKLREYDGTKKEFILKKHKRKNRIK
ncbi:hypothetical protein [Bacillus paramycoides]|uniref:hypothetical protein n=1 Tax=Bacillus paramycoides TaxID=2026194 RepID=UPI002E1BFADF|nr:hypothetical protein [Bacillus paramycoides]